MPHRALSACSVEPHCPWQASREVCFLSHSEDAFHCDRVYLGIGVAGAIFTTSLLLLPRTPLAFCIATVGENIFQALSLTGSLAITYETIGRNNPFAATQYSLLYSVVEVPIMYMTLADGRAYGWHRVSGALGADAFISIVACIFMGLLLFLCGNQQKQERARRR